jgi:DNA-binding MarR family transcriptional regulator
VPEDVLVLAKLVSYGGRRPAMAQIAADLGLSPSQVHASLKRLERSRLIAPSTNEPQLRAVEEFLLHGVKYAFPAVRGKPLEECPRRMPPLR